MIKNFLRFLFICITKIILYPYVFFFQNVRFKYNKNKLPKGNFVLIGNHQSNWDGVWANLMFPFRFIHFIVNDELFRTRFSSFLAGDVLQQIKRGTTMNDISGIRRLIEVKKAGKNIGIYPEGDIAYWNTNLDITLAIAKLVKGLKLPIVFVRIEGARIRSPRWANSPYRARPTYSFNRLITADELDGLDVEDLFEIIKEEITYDDNQWQIENKVRVVGFNRAENLERGLYYCPKCNGFETLKSKKHTLLCTNCGYSVDHSRSFQFVSKKNDVIFANVNDWDKTQENVLYKLIESKNEEDIILSAENIFMAHTDETIPFSYKEKEKGSLYLYKDRIIFKTENEKTKFMLEDVYQEFLNFKQTLEFRFNDEVYRFEKKAPWSAFMWVRSIKHVKEKY